MSPFPSLLKLISSAACVLPVLLCCGRVQGQENLAIEVKEARATLQASAARIADLESRLTKAKQNVNDLAEALASANGDGQQAREAYERLRAQMEGLGPAALDPSSLELQQRLLTSISDLRILRNQRDSLLNSLMSLSQATLDYAKVAGRVDGQPKSELDAKLAQAEQVMAKVQEEAAPANETELHNARVVSLKDDAGIAVLNVGSRHGVHAGMPFAIYRQDKPIASALVVDVRPDVCGVVIRDLVSKDDPVKLKDIGKVEAVKN